MPGQSRHPHISLKPFLGFGNKDDQKLFPDTTSNVAEVRHDGTVFKIKLMQARFGFSTPIIDITGEFTDNLGGTSGTVVRDTTLRGLSQINGQVTLAGHVPFADPVGIANLEKTAAQDLDIKIVLGEGAASDPEAADVGIEKLALAFRMVAESVTIDWSVEQPFIGVTITGRTTGQYGGSGDPIQETGADVAGNDA